jgi:hypothetical protein
LQELDLPESIDALYEERGQVPLALPMMQGNVFIDVACACFDNQASMVMIMSHPCSMRKGAVLRERLIVALVTSSEVAVASKVVKEFHWKRNVNVMPLPDLVPGGGDYVVDFREMATISSNLLLLERRIAALSETGVLLLQQRHICSATRLYVDLSALHDLNRHITTEMELQRDWVEAASGSSADAAKHVEAIRGFQDWLDQDGRRDKLLAPYHHAGIRREARSEIRRRFGTRENEADLGRG